jgi:hypothetical protein
MINEELFAKSPRMVQLRHQSAEQGFSVIAECDYDPRGAEVGFYTAPNSAHALEQARERGRLLKRQPTKWISNTVGFVMIYDVSTMQIVEEVF